MSNAIKIDMSQLTDLVCRVNEEQVLEPDWAVIKELVNRYYDSQKKKWERQRESLEETASASGSSELKTHQDYNEEPANLTADPAPRKGHGKRSLEKYSPAVHINHDIDGFSNGQACHECSGKIYQDRPRKILRFVGDATLKSEVHHIQQARCRCCGVKLVANYPEKLDCNIAGFEYQACAALLVLHYFGGTPFKRLEMIQNWMGTKISDSKLWEVTEASALVLQSVYDIQKQVALNSATSVRYDDTGANINYKESSTRSVNASVFYFESPQGTVVLFFTGFHHAGEVVDDLLAKRSEHLPKLVSTSDAAAKNFDHSQKNKVIPTVCNTHAYRRFKDIKENYPDEFEYVKRIYSAVYEHDEYCKKRHFSAECRLRYHQDNSLPLMENLRNWAHEKIKSESIDLNSGIADAVSYLANQWVKLTEFLRTPGVPLDTNLAEQVVKTVIRYRNNSRAYRNTNGANIGDRIMSLGQTVISNGKSPFDYFIWCFNNKDDLEINPHKYTPLEFVANSS